MISERLGELEKWSSHPPKTPYQFVRHRAFEDNSNEERKVMLESQKKHLEKLVDFLKEITTFHIALAKVMFALGEEFQKIADLLAKVVEQSTSWKLVCDAYQLWGYCCLIKEEQQSAEDKFMLVLNLAADKKYKPWIAAQEMECLLSKRLQSCAADEKDSLSDEEDSLLIKMACVLRCSGQPDEAQSILSQVNTSSPKFRQLLLCSLQSSRWSEGYRYAEELLRCEDMFGSLEFIKVCFHIAATEEPNFDRCILFGRVIRLCLARMEVERGIQDIVVFHSDDVYDCVHHWITRLNDVSSVDIHSAHELYYIGKPILEWLEQLLTSTKRAIIFLTDEYFASEEATSKCLMHVANTSDYAAKLVVFYCNEEQLVTLPKSICKIQLQKHEMGTELCTRQLAYALAKDAFGSHNVTVDGLIQEITNLTLKQ